MTDVAESIEKKKRFRSPAYPALDLEKAVERTALLLKMAQHHAVGVQVVLKAWEMDSDTGPVWRYLAALIQYRLLVDSGTGKTRKFQITDIARRIIQDSDHNSQKRKEALKIAALSPKVHKELWEKFGAATELSDAILKVHLTLDRMESGDGPYSDASASEVIQTYRASLAYAGIANSDKVPPVNSTMEDDVEEPTPPPAVRIGDYIQWKSNGIDQFRQPRKVVGLFDDGTHVQVFGSNTGIPVNELSVVQAPAPSPPSIGVGSAEGGSAWAQGENELNVLQKGNRLQITADVDLAGIDDLKDILGHYEAILKRLGARIPK